MTALSVHIVNGNLRFVRRALMVGHYHSQAFTGAEHVVDSLLGGAMQRELELGSYPQTLDKQSVFINKHLNKESLSQLPRPCAVVVLGLGEENNLDGKKLSQAVCQGVLAWAARLREGGNLAAPFEMAATLIGSGGSRIGVGQSALLVVDGVQEANRRLAKQDQHGVGSLELIELYADRAEEAWAALNDLAATDGFTFGHIRIGVGRLKRPLDLTYRGATYDLVSVAQERQNDAQTLSFAISTKRARTEVRGASAQFTMVRDLIADPEDPDLGRTLFQYLVPSDLQPFLAASSGAVLELDSASAAIPWELLDPGDGASRPWAISAKLVRKLRTPEVPAQVSYAGGNAHALVIGEPACNERRYGRLPVSAQEGKEVAGFLKNILGPERVCDRVRGEQAPNGWSGVDILKALLDREWRIVHVAGHGDLPEWIATNPSPVDQGAAGVQRRTGAPRGVVLSNGHLGQAEFRQMKRVPELVFINCCYLGAQGADQLGKQIDTRDQRYDRVRYAASLAESLIETGVRCVIAAGWPVDEEPARVFATAFYRALEKGKRYIEATAAAREAARARGGDTWAAYQCYGDPDWTLGRASDLGPASPETTFAEMASAEALLLALEFVTVEATYDKEAKARLPEILEHLERRFASRWSELGAVAEAFGKAWTECGKSRAIEWYDKALRTNDGTASIRTAEQLGNLRARSALEAARKELAEAEPPPEGVARKAAIERARGELKKALELLQYLVTIQPNVERESLCGSAWKLIAQLERLAGDEHAERAAIVNMEARYGAAEEHARETNYPDWFYPAQNRMIAQLILGAADPSWAGFTRERVEAVMAALKAKSADDPDFWSAAGLIELRVYDALAARRLADARDALESEYVDLNTRVPSAHLWASVRNQLQFVVSTIPQGPELAAATSLLAVLKRFSQAPAGA